MNPRFEIVHTDAGWHVRLLGGNGEKVMTSEVYTRRETALEAVDVAVEAVDVHGLGDIEDYVTFTDERTVQG